MTKKLPLYGLLIVSLFPLFNIKGVSILIITFSLLSIIYLISDFQNRWSPDVKSFIFTSIPFSLYLIGMFYTDDIRQGFRALEIGLPLFLFPFLYFIVLGKRFILGNKEKEVLLKSFTISGSVLIFLIICYLCFSGLFYGLFDEEMLLKTTQNMGRDMVRWAIENTPYIGEHPTYFGIISIFVALISVFKISNNQYIYLPSLVIGIIGVFISGSKMSIVTLVLMVFISLFFLIKSIKKRIIIFFGVFIILLVIFESIPMIKVRFTQVMDANFDPPKDLRYSSTNVRIAIYQCSFVNIQKAPVFGNGTRGYINGMRTYYRKYDTDIFKKNDYFFNSHNQYLSIVLSNGIVGFILFVLWLLVFLKSSVVIKDRLYLSLIVVYVIMFFTENLIERQTGNVLFCFLIILFYKNYIDIFAKRKINNNK